ncbi:MAG: hypothetical protein ACXWCG_11520 [Flavitalea sp.]
METLKLEEFGQLKCLSDLEAQQIDGGGFWKDVAYVLGVAAHGLVVFATEGGRNAGIVVK